MRTQTDTAPAGASRGEWHKYSARSSGLDWLVKEELGVADIPKASKRSGTIPGIGPATMPAGAHDISANIDALSCFDEAVTRTIPHDSSARRVCMAASVMRPCMQPAHATSWCRQTNCKIERNAHAFRELGVA